MLRSWDTRDGARVSVPALTLLDDLGKSFLPLGLSFLNCLMGTPIFACLAIVKPESIQRIDSFTRASRTKIQSFPQEIWAGWLGSWARGGGGGVAEGRMGQTEGQGGLLKLLFLLNVILQLRASWVGFPRAGWRVPCLVCHLL